MKDFTRRKLIQKIIGNMLICDALRIEEVVEESKKLEQWTDAQLVRFFEEN